jgi:hypothetical protein
VQDRNLLLGVQAGDHEHLRALDVPVGRRQRRGGRRLFRVPAVERAPVIHVVRAERHARQLRQRVRVLVRAASAGENATQAPVDHRDRSTTSPRPARSASRINGVVTRPGRSAWRKA